MGTRGAKPEYLSFGWVPRYWLKEALKVRKTDLAGQTDLFAPVSAIREHPSKLQYSITPLLHHSITPSLHYSITPLLHYSNIPSLHHSVPLRYVRFSALTVAARPCNQDRSGRRSEVFTPSLV